MSKLDVSISPFGIKLSQYCIEMILLICIRYACILYNNQFEEL